MLTELMSGLGTAVALMAVTMIAVIAAVICISIFNAVERGRTRTDESFADVDVALCRRYDQIAQMVSVVKHYMNHESKIILDTTAMRRSGGTVEEMEKSTKDMDEMWGKIQAVAEAYPELRSSDAFITLLNSIQDCEQNLQAARRVYNHNASIFNSSRKEFPTSFFAKKYAPYSLLRCESYKRDVPSISL